MLKEILKNLVSKPATVNYPFVKPEPLPATRGALSWDMDRCDQCQVLTEEKRIEYQPFKCLFCFICIDNCMQQAISNSTTLAAPGYEKRVEVFEIKKQ
jgi:ech hydrogenase subunit F